MMAFKINYNKMKEKPQRLLLECNLSITASKERTVDHVDRVREMSVCV